MKRTLYHCSVLVMVAAFMSNSRAGEPARLWKEAGRRVMLDQTYQGNPGDAWRVNGKLAITNDSKAGTCAVAEADGTVVSIGTERWQDYTAEFRVKPMLAAQPLTIRIYPSTIATAQPPCECSVFIGRTDPARKGMNIDVWAVDGNDKSFKRKANLAYAFAPADSNLVNTLEAAGIKPHGWENRWLTLKIEAGKRNIKVWFEGRLVTSIDDPLRKSGILQLSLANGDMLSAVKVCQDDEGITYVPIDLGSLYNNSSRTNLGDGWRTEEDALPPAGKLLEVAGIPLQIGWGDGCFDNFALKWAQWTDWKQDDAGLYGEAYDSGPVFQNDPRWSVLRVPNAGYSAVYVLGVADTSQNTSDAVSFRMGRFGGLGIYNDSEGRVPRWTGGSNADVLQKIPIHLRSASGERRDGCLFLVRIPLNSSFPQDFQAYGDWVDMEVTKQLRLAVRCPDPCKFRIRALGEPSAVHILAMTLEQSPVQMTVVSDETGHVFNEPQTPAFHVRLRNIAPEARDVTVTAVAKNGDGQMTRRKFSATLPPLAEKEQIVSFEGVARGYYDLTLSLRESGVNRLTRKTSLALLPKDTRDRSVDAPWGTWNWGGSLNTKTLVEEGPLLRKLGMRYTLSGPDADMMKYGMRAYASRWAKTTNCIPDIRAYFDQSPHALRRVLAFHEDIVSGPHIMRPIDCLLDRTPYRMDSTETNSFNAMWDGVSGAAKLVRANFPDVQILFGNGQPQTVEEFLRHDYPKEYFDAVGSENQGFMRPTEAQPDNVSFNTVWILRQILDQYGYKGKLIDACYEWVYRSTNPGNISETDQANYYVRDGLLALAWGFRHINPAMITDVGASYYYGNWGASGFLHHIPEMNPKPSYVAFATLTLVLDKAKFVKIWPTGSLSLYCLEFIAGDGKHLFALWTTRGERDVALKFDATVKGTITDWQARETSVAAKDGTLALKASESPVYLSMAKANLLSITPGKCSYATTATRLGLNPGSKPAHRPVLISKLDTLDDWRIESGRNLELDLYNFDTPRREGRFEFAVVDSFEGEKNALKVQPLLPVPGTAFQPMYKAMALKHGVPLPGEPTKIGLLVNGNSGWGRVIFELVDASGQHWISIGASAASRSMRLMPDWLSGYDPAQTNLIAEADWNVNDTEGLSAINFDGWRYIAFPLPGQYPGEQYHWPRNCCWKYDKDGIVHYPLVFTKLIVELREKVVYGTDFIKPPRDAVYLKDLTATYE